MDDIPTWHLTPLLSSSWDPHKLCGKVGPDEGKGVERVEKIRLSLALPLSIPSANSHLLGNEGRLGHITGNEK